MKEHRHPHPHLDPRQPRDDTKPGTNPPVFAWKPVDGACYRLTIGRDADLQQPYLAAKDLADPLFLPEQAFEPGRYFWQWSSGESKSEVFSFEITTDAVTVEVPPASEWLARLPSAHPRIYVRPEDVDALRASREGERQAQWAELQQSAETLLAESHDIEEPPFLPDWSADYEAAYKVWAPILWESRRFVKGAQTLGLACLASGETKYARAACQRMASISRWDPEGSSHIGHNDEAHMSVIWDGPAAVDWVWDQFTDEERSLVIEQFRQRGQITYEHMHGRGSYGVTRFDSHAGREIIFLANIAFVFHDRIPEAREWLDWLRPVLCGVWPIWAGDDGAWAEGPSYGLAYVGIMTMFATALKRGAGVDLYQRPFWEGHAEWRQWCWPHYGEWIGFGDHSERWASSWLRNADLVETIDSESGADRFADYVSALRREAESMDTPSDRQMPDMDPQRYLRPAPPSPSIHNRQSPVANLEVFPAAGAAAIRTDLDDASRDIAMVFRSSPFGAISHSHANNNDFFLNVGGKTMAMPSGYYAGYGSDHHQHWVWHTKSHNCVTLSDASQVMRSHESTGAIVNAFEDERLAYFCGVADASYRDRATKCRRHVVFLKRHQCFLMVDDFVAVPGIASALQWNLHSWNEFEVDEEGRTFLLERGGSTLCGHFLWHRNGFFSLTEGWDPPPMDAKDKSQWHQQYHLRFTPSGIVERRVLGTILCPGHASLTLPELKSQREGDAEVADLGDDLVIVGQGGGIDCRGIVTEALAALVVDETTYTITDDGVQTA